MNKVHNVGAGHADFDKSFKTSWWRGQKVGKKERVHEPQEVSKMSWPDVEAANQGEGGGNVRVGGGNSESWQLATDNLNSFDEEIPDFVGNSLPQLP